MFLTLKLYRVNLLNPKLTLNQLNQVKSISDLKRKLINAHIISEQNMDKLIEKNWRSHNYEQNS